MSDAPLASEAKELVDVRDVPTQLRVLHEYLRKLPADFVGLELANEAGVYFLCRGDEIVYVGESTKVASRVSAHIGGKKFDRAYYLRISKSDLKYVEARFICALEPPLNLARRYAVLEKRSSFAVKLTELALGREGDETYA